MGLAAADIVQVVTSHLHAYGMCTYKLSLLAPLPSRAWPHTGTGKAGA
jgi:hypothetical protein